MCISIFKLTPVFMLCFVVFPAISASAAEKKPVTIKAQCVSTINGRPVTMRNQKIVANFFEKGMIHRTVNNRGYLKFSSRFKNSAFRLDGVGPGREIIPGCNTGAIQKLKGGMVVLFSGIDCGAVEACNKAGK